MSRRKWWLVLAAAVVVIGGVGLALGLSNDSGRDQLAATTPSASPTAPAPEPSEEPAASPAPSAAPSAAEAPVPAGAPAFWATADADAVAAIQGYLDASQVLLEDPSGSFEPLAAVSVGSALGAAEAQALEFRDLQARISGRSQIETITVTQRSLEADPPTLVVTACLDDSGVTVYTLENPDGTATPRRNQEVFTVIYDGSTWKVSERTFADEPNC